MRPRDVLAGLAARLPAAPHKIRLLVAGDGSVACQAEPVRAIFRIRSNWNWPPSRSTHQTCSSITRLPTAQSTPGAGRLPRG